MHTCTCTIQPTACGLLGRCAGSGLSKTSVWIYMESKTPFMKQYYVFYFNYGRGSQIPPFILHLKETSPITLILVIGSSNFARETRRVM